MKGITGGRGHFDLCKSTILIKISGFLLISVIFFYLGKHFSDGTSQQLLFFSSRQSQGLRTALSTAVVSLSPNLNKTFDISSLINNNTASSTPQQSGRTEPQQAPTPPPSPPPPAALQKMEVVDEKLQQAPTPPPPPPALQKMGVVDEKPQQAPTPPPPPPASQKIGVVDEKPQQAPTPPPPPPPPALQKMGVVDEKPQQASTPPPPALQKMVVVDEKPQQASTPPPPALQKMVVVDEKPQQASSPPPPALQKMVVVDEKPQQASSPPPPPPALQTMGVVDENGWLSNDFEVGEYDPEPVDNKMNGSEGLESDRKGNKVRVRRVMRFPMCPKSMKEYIPCLDNEDAIKKLKATDKGEKFERHCPEEGKGLNCLIPAPRGYRAPIPWPRSRDEVWFSNVPHARLAVDKGGQNWITVDKNKFKFPGGGTQFIHGANQYLDQIEKMVPEIAFGQHTRVALDVGCGVASFGAYLMSRNVLTLSIAPKDAHENQIQFALERGVPAMVAAFATRRLLYPSQAFDLIHCSRCRINWTRDDGIYLLEVNRMLRAGGYFVWAAQPVYKHEAVLEEQWKDMVNLTRRLCWTLVKMEGYIAIWQKALNNSCYLSREEGTQPPLCEPNDDPDNVWYVDMKACITRLPQDGSGSNVTAWPERLMNPPDRLHSIHIDSYISSKELFGAETSYWKEIIDGYVIILHWDKYKLRNVLDMKAGFGGFASALYGTGLDCWVLNVVPVGGPNTLPVIYDRGLIGVMHDWCEPFDTYPRTYDLIHAAGLLSLERKRKRCNISSIMLEMDRMLRPGGRVYIRDLLSIMDELQDIAKALGWHIHVMETAEGPHASYRIFYAVKRLIKAGH